MGGGVAKNIFFYSYKRPSCLYSRKPLETEDKRCFCNYLQWSFQPMVPFDLLECLYKRFFEFYR